MKFLYILYNSYERVYITKPFTSRPANSEKYIVCEDFKTVDNSFINLLLYHIKYWNYYSKNNYENFTISSKNNDGIFDVQKIIFNLL